MTKRQLAWAGIALTVVVPALGVTDRLLSAAAGRTEANCRRIRVGMRFAEVVARLGDWPGCDDPRSVESMDVRPGTLYWYGADGCADITLDADLRVVTVRFRRSPTPSLLGHLRDWLRW